MPRNPSTGVYSKPAGTTPSVGQVIDPVPWNALTTDLGNEITNSLPRDGSAPMVSPIKLASGSAAAPGLGFASDPTTGLYLKAAGLGAIAATGVEIATWSSAAGFSINGALTVSGALSYASISGEPERGKLYGLTLANNSGDATNDIDVASGFAASDGTTPFVMQLPSALTKRLDAAWAVGSGNGGLDTGSIANTTYHVWLIQRSDTGVVDALFSTSATAPTLPANYDRKRRIGSILRRSASIAKFNQFGDYFNLFTQIVDFASSSNFPTALLTLSVPSGIVVRPLLVGQAATGAGGVVQNSMGSGAAGNVTLVPYQQIGPNQSDYTTIDFVSTNTSSQIYLTSSVSGVILTNILLTTGWVDTRGRT